jgi:hypothetical protein
VRRLDIAETLIYPFIAYTRDGKIRVVSKDNLICFYKK